MTDREKLEALEKMLERWDKELPLKYQHRADRHWHAHVDALGKNTRLHIGDVRQILAK